MSKPLLIREEVLPFERLQKPSQAGTTPIVLRLPTELLEQVDSLLKHRPVRLPRHTWILEAVYEKMKRESAAASRLIS